MFSELQLLIKQYRQDTGSWPGDEKWSKKFQNAYYTDCERDNAKTIIELETELYKLVKTCVQLIENSSEIDGKVIIDSKDIWQVLLKAIKYLEEKV